MRRRHDYFRMEELGIYAAKVNPLADWEIVTMEALISTGRYADAEKLYEDTVDLYLQEQGLRPSPRLMELLNKLGGQMGRQYAVLDDIQMELAEADSMRQGGYVCSYPVFQGIYRMITRLIERGGQSVYLMLCTVVDSKGNPMKAGPMLEDLSQRLGDAIQPFRTARRCCKSVWERAVSGLAREYHPGELQYPAAADQLPFSGGAAAHRDPVSCQQCDLYGRRADIDLKERMRYG